MSHEMHELSTRLETLERENRRLKKVGTFAACGLGLLALASFAAPVVCDVLYGERLVIRDSRGNQRVKIDAYTTETPGLELLDRAGKTRAKFNLDADGEAFLTVYDAKGNVKANHALGVVHEAQAPSTPSGEKKTDPATMTSVYFSNF